MTPVSVSRSDIISLYQDGKHQTALEYLDIFLAGVTADSIDRGWAFKMQALCDCALQNFSSAYQKIDQAIALFERLNSLPDLGAAWTNKGGFFWTERRLDDCLSAYQNSKTYLTQALAEAKDDQTRQRLINSLLILDLNIALCYNDLHRFIEAENLFKDVLTRIHSNHPHYPTAMNNLSVIYLMWSEQSHVYYAQCQRTIKTAIRLLRKHKNENQLRLAECYLTLARLYSLHKKYRHALKWVQEAAARTVTPLQVYDYKYEQAVCYHGLNEDDRATALLREVIAWTDENPAAWLAALAHACLGRIYRKQKQIESALTHYKRAIAAAESVQALAARHEEDRSNALSEYLSIYEEAVTLCLEDPGRLEQALAFAEQARSRLLLDLLLNRLSIVTINETDWTRLRLKLDELYRQLHETGPETGTRRGQSGQLTAEILKLEQQLRKLLTPYRQGDRASAPDASALLPPPDTAGTVLEYFVAKGQLLAFMIQNGRTSYIPLGEFKSIRNDAVSLKNLLAEYSAYTEAPEDAVFYLNRLYTRLVAPLEATLTAPLTIIPHAELHYVPFQAMTANDGFLADRYALNYAPSLQIWQHCRRKVAAIPAADYPALLVGVPDKNIPRVQDEMDALRELFPQAKVLYGRDATRANLLKYAPHCRYVHISSHAFFRPDNPLFSAVRLQDGLLHVPDIYRLPLNARLVTLSACETARRQVLAGDELLGLLRGFLYAGAPALLLSLWLVDDDTAARLMPDFYRRVLAGQDLPAALQQAQQTVRQTKPDVFHWAPFVLIGA